MVRKDYIVEKIKAMPDDLAREVTDFIDFLEDKRRREKIYSHVEKEASRLMESDMADYLSGLVVYEEMLARGEVEWK